MSVIAIRMWFQLLPVRTARTNSTLTAVVVTTRAIANAFNNGMEYFNTFGGNPVSCAIGLAVMRVIEKEGLQEHARRTGAWLIDRFRELQQQHAVVSDVRGSGFFLGIELHDPASGKPATALAAVVINRLCDRCILLSTDGPHANVLKFKPPMFFSQADTERVVTALDKVLC